MSEALIIRDARDADIPAIASIYGHDVLHGLASFETEAPGAQEMARRRREILARNFPYLVAELVAESRAMPMQTTIARVSLIASASRIRSTSIRPALAEAWGTSCLRP